MKKVISTLLLFVSLLTVNGQEPVWKNVHGQVSVLFKNEIETMTKNVHIQKEDTVMDVTLLSDCELKVEVIIVNSYKSGTPPLYRQEFSLKKGDNKLQIPVKDLKCYPRDSYFLYVVESGSRHYGGVSDLGAELEKY